MKNIKKIMRWSTVIPVIAAATMATIGLSELVEKTTERYIDWLTK